MPFKKITTEDFCNKLKNYVGSEYTLVGEYLGGSVPTLFRHNACGRIIKKTPNHLIYDNHRCRCGLSINAKDPKVYKKQFYSVTDSKSYVLMSTYVGAHKKVVVKHLKCSHTYSVEANAFLMGERCPYCFGNQKKTTSKFATEVNQVTSGEYKLMSDYYNNRTPVTIKHNICNKEYKVTPHDFVCGNRCPYCKESKGEKLIQHILESIHEHYIIQKVFDDCGSNNQRLPFDFYLPSRNLLIEYDGIQHFKPVLYFGGQAKLNDQKRRDAIKNNYAINHSLSVLRVSYQCSKDTLPDKLTKFINSRNAENLKPKVEIMI